MTYASRVIRLGTDGGVENDHTVPNPKRSVSNTLTMDAATNPYQNVFILKDQRRGIRMLTTVLKMKMRETIVKLTYAKRQQRW